MIAAPSGPSSRTLKRLFGLSNNRCAFPRCPCALIDGPTVIGEACHIRAASPGGPRFDPDQTPADRHGFENLILLCANHHTVIDDDEVAYTVERLLAMKAAHENASAEMADDDAEQGARIISIGQSGGVTAQKVEIQTAYFHGGQESSPVARESAAVAFLAPELARVLAYQVYALDRAAVNFSEISVGRGVLNDNWEIFRPRRPLHYPHAAQVRDLGADNGALLAEFYSALDEIEALFSGWRDAELQWDINAWNVLMQKIGASITAGVAAADRFCPGRQFDSTMPASGTLAERAARSLKSMQSTLLAHNDRFSGSEQAGAFARAAELAASARGLAPEQWPGTRKSDRLQERLQTAWWSFLNSRIVLRDLPVVVSHPSVLVHVTPEAMLGDPLLLDLLAIDRERSLLQLPGEAHSGGNASHWWAHGAKRSAPARMPEADWASTFFRPGVVEWELNLGRAAAGEEPAEVDMERLEDLVIDAIDRSLAFLEAVGIRGPALASAVLYGMEMAAPKLRDRPGQRFRQQSFSGSPVLLPAGERQSCRHLRPMFEAFWLEAGSPLGSPSFNGDRWIRARP